MRTTLEKRIRERKLHWIETAAASYVGKHSSESGKQEYNDLSELGLDDEIEEQFEAACKHLYIMQENEKEEKPIRSDLPKPHPMLRSRPIYLVLNMTSQKMSGYFVSG